MDLSASTFVTSLARLLNSRAERRFPNRLRMTGCFTVLASNAQCEISRGKDSIEASLYWAGKTAAFFKNKSRSVQKKVVYTS